jgi:hypothetical protein
VIIVDILSLTSNTDGEITQTTISPKEIELILQQLEIDDKEESDKAKKK